MLGDNIARQYGERDIIITDPTEGETIMEVLICSVRKTLWKTLFALTDKFLCKKRARYMSVSTNLFSSRRTISEAVKKYGSAIVILDVDSFTDWQSIAKDIERDGRGVKICLVSGSGKDAVDAINTLTSLCGYVCEGKLSEMYKEVIERLYGRIKTICGGIALTHYSSVDKVIPYDDIYYIETIKRTHMCSIVQKNGCDEIRADISKLIAELDVRFQYARSSVIVNLSMINSVRDSEIFFPDDKSCFCTEKYAPHILPALKGSLII